MSAAPVVKESALLSAETTVDDGGTYDVVELKRIRNSPDNRKRFNPDALNELAASIKDIGVAQPILLRPVAPTADQPEDYEIVAGERRFRASGIAGLATIPAMVRKLTDLQAAKIRILENLQREDPHPMEEADGYQQLMLTFGYSADQLAEEVKKSRAYIYGRLKLCALTNDVREQFLDNKISASTALLIARIPLPKLQAKALTEVTEDRGYPAAPMSYRAAAGWIQSRYTLNLIDAVFSPGDAKLLPPAGACTTCPKRSGNQPDVMEDLKNADVCTDPDCFGEKRLAFYERLAGIAIKKGVPVHESTSGEAQAIRSNQWNRESDLVTASLHLTYFARNAPATKNSGTALSVLGVANLPPAAAYIRTPDCTLQAWYKRDVMQAALEAAGACETPAQHAERMDELRKNETETPSSPPGAITQAQKVHDERARRAAKETEFRIALYRKLRAKGAAGFTLESLREFAKLMVRDDNNYCIPDDMISDVYPFEKGTDDAVCAYIDQASLAEVQMILVDLALGECLSVGVNEIDDLEDSWKAPTFDAMKAMASCEGIDAETVRVDIMMIGIALEDLADDQLGSFVRANPQRLKELAEYVVAERPHLLSALEAAAFIHGFTYTADGFRRTDIAPAKAEAAPVPIAPPATPAKKAPKKAAKSAPAQAVTVAPPADTPVAQGKTKLTPAAAWPFPKSSDGARAEVAK